MRIVIKRLNYLIDDWVIQICIFNLLTSFTTYSFKKILQSDHCDLKKKFLQNDNVTKSINDDDKNVLRMMQIIIAIKQLLIKITLRDNHWCVKLNSISKRLTKAKTKLWMKLSSNFVITSDSEKLWFEMLIYIKLKILINKSIRFD
jgi:hypothetical protein